MIAHQVGAKATRDALFLSHFPVTWLPAAQLVSAIVTIVVILATSGAMRALGPGRVLPAAYVASAALHLVEWRLLAPATQRLAAVAVYLHVVSFGPVLISGFWSMLSEGADPRANKRRIRRAALAGAVAGGLGGHLSGPRHPF